MTVEDKRFETARPVNLGAEKWLNVETQVLDHGFLRLVDYMGGDADVENAARISYGGGTRKVSETRGLLRYLMRNDHTSPFEMVSLKFHQKMPVFVARQWVRHRTASLNEYSARYSVVKDEFYMPDASVLSVQATNNKQGRGDTISPEMAEEVQNKLRKSFEDSHELYRWLLDPDNGPGLAREIARLPLSVGVYTEWIWKANLHNILHLLKLRMDPHAQYEIREHANAMADVVKDAVPIAWEAFQDYKINSLPITGPEQVVLIDLLAGKGVIFDASAVEGAAKKLGITNKREIGELKAKLQKLQLMKPIE